MANFFNNGNYWLTLWLTANTNLYIQSKIGEKCQAHNLKVVGSNPTPATNYSIKSISYATSKISIFGVFLRFKPDNDYRVINKVINVRHAFLVFLTPFLKMQPLDFF